MNRSCLVLMGLIISAVPAASRGFCANLQAATFDTGTELKAVPYGESGLRNRTCGKGFILTARKIEGEWFFILYPNVNRGARVDERTSAKGLNQTERMLESVARGQEVNWIPQSAAEAPPCEVLEELAEYCRKNGLSAWGFPTMKQQAGSWASERD